MSVFFGTRKAAFISLLFGIAVLALLYIAYRQVEEAAQIELPAGQADSQKSNASTARPTASPEILVINSYHVGHAWSDNEMAGIIEILKEASPEIRYDIEYLDCKHHPGYEHFELVKNLFKLKYGSRDIPVVIVTDNPALEFVLKYRSLLCPRSSIVFCGVNNYKKKMLEGQGNITGLAEALDAVDTMRIALKLHPKTREVFIVHDYTSTGLATGREAKEQMQGMFGQISFRYAQDMTRKELTQFLKDLPQDSLVLALTYNVFRDGEVLGHEDTARLLSANAPVPVYGVHQERLGYGIVGGSLLSGRLHGAEAARVALKIVSGTPASSIPVDMHPPTRMMFDYNQLVRFGIPIKTLPADSVVVNRPVSFISSHKYLVVSTLLVIVILTSGIFILGSNVYRRMLVEEALRKSKEELEMRVSERTAELQNANEKLQCELTERKLAQELLEVSERRLSEAQRIAHVGSWELHLLKNELTWSDEMYRIFGLTPREFGATYEAFLEAVHPDDRDYVHAGYTGSVKNGTPYDIIHRIVRKSDGEVRFVHEKCEHTRDEAGRVIRSLGTLHDITEIKRNEEELKRLTQIHDMILNSAGEGIYGTDMEGNIIFSNTAAQEMLGFRGEELIGRNSHQAFHNTRADGRPYPFEECPLYKSLKDGESYRGQDEVFRASDGRMFDVELVHTLLVENDRVVGAVAVFRDITERKKVEEEIRKLNEELEQRVIRRTADLERKSLELQDSHRALMNLVDDLNWKTLDLEAANNKLRELDRLKSMFIASMSHELRTPLNSIIGFTSIILQGMTGEINEEQRDQLQRVLKGGKHLLALITDVIDITKIEAGKIEAYAEEFALDGVLHEVVSNLIIQIREKGLEIEVSTIPEKIVLRTDRKRLFQCVLNYLSNAVKFTEKGKITVVAEEKGDRIQIMVTDTGIGIKEEDLPMLFHSFVRLESNLKLTVPGTGLGLYLTKKLVTEVLDGEVWVASTYGKGSTFAVSIPKNLGNKPREDHLPQ